MVGGRGVRLEPGVGRPRRRVLPGARPPRGPPRQGALEARCGSPARSSVEWLEELFPDALRRERVRVRRRARAGVVGVEPALVPRPAAPRGPHAGGRPGRGVAALAEALAPGGRVRPRGRGRRGLAGPLGFVTQAMPELDWPELDDAGLGRAARRGLPGKRTRRGGPQGRLVPHPAGPADARAEAASSTSRPPRRSRSPAAAGSAWPTSPAGRRSWRSGSRSCSAGPRRRGWPAAACRSCSTCSARTTARCRSPTT